MPLPFTIDIVGWMQILPLDPHDDAKAQDWYAALFAGASANRTAPLVVGAESLLIALRSNDSNPNYDRRGIGAWAGGRCLGTAVIGLPRRDNLHLAEIDVNVRPEDRGNGVGRALLEAALVVARQHDRTTIVDEVHVAQGLSMGQSSGGRFALANGFVSQHTEQRLLLELPLPEATLRELEESARVKSAGYQVITWIGMPPDRYLDAFARMRTLMGRDAPSGEIDREPVVYDADRIRQSVARTIEQGYRLVTAMVLDPAGAPAGYTTMYVMADPTNVMQDDTFVLRFHRGHGLGVLAKAANLRQLVSLFPGTRFVHTWTASVNDRMRIINDRFGFRDVETMHQVECALP